MTYGGVYSDELWYGLAVVMEFGRGALLFQQNLSFFVLKYKEMIDKLRGKGYNNTINVNEEV